jgi:pheromone shutdown protein TraB
MHPLLSIPYRMRYSKSEMKTLRQIFNFERDENMANNIRELYGNGDKTVVSVVGAAHLYEIGERLKDLDPTLVPLAEYKQIQNENAPEQPILPVEV